MADYEPAFDEQGRTPPQVMDEERAEARAGSSGVVEAAMGLAGEMLGQ